MNRTALILSFLSTAAFIAAAWVFFAPKNTAPEQNGMADYKLIFSKKINSAVKIATAGDKIFAITYDLKLYAFDLSGKALYETKLSKKSYPQSFAVHNGIIYIGTDDGDVLAVSASDGRELWSRRFKEKTGRDFGFWKDKILFGAFDKNLHMLDNTGMEIFSMESSDAINGKIEISEDMAYFGNCTGDVEALDLLSLKSVWKKSAGSHIPFAPKISGDALLAADFQGTISAFNPKTGETLWSNENMNAMADSQIQSYGGMFFFADKDGNFLMADSGSGKILKSLPLGEKRMDIYANENRILLTLADGRIKVLNAEGLDEIFSADMQIRIDSAGFSKNIIAILDADSSMHIFSKQ